MSKSVITVSGSDLSIMLDRIAAHYGNINSMRLAIAADEGSTTGYLHVSINNGTLEWIASGRVGNNDPVGELQELVADYNNGALIDSNTDATLRRIMELLPLAYDKLVTG